MQRPPDTDSAEHLAQALDAAGLVELAKQAREGRYHDYRSTLVLPAMQLDTDLAKAISAGNLGAVSVRRRHHAGEFDAPDSEAQDLPPEVRAAFKEIAKAEKRPKTKKRARKRA